MRKILIFGNSGSGKSTLAKKLCLDSGLAHLDLDTLAWQPGSPPERKPKSESKIDIDNFIRSHESWVVEGCYADLLEMVTSESNEMIFLNLPVEVCITNAKSRAWEPHKYESKEAQDTNLKMLIAWISEYSVRTGVFSKAAHVRLYETYPGKKIMLTSNA